MTKHSKFVKILLVEDNEGDIELTKESLSSSKLVNKLYVAMDGEEALDFLFKRGKYKQSEEPDIILLDLNLPKLDGREVLEIIKGNDRLKKIPVVVLTTSEADKDILRMYNLNASSYLTKPIDFNSFVEMMKTFTEFWLGIVKLPSGRIE